MLDFFPSPFSSCFEFLNPPFDDFCTAKRDDLASNYDESSDFPPSRILSGSPSVSRGDTPIRSADLSTSSPPRECLLSEAKDLVADAYTSDASNTCSEPIFIAEYEPQPYFLQGNSKDNYFSGIYKSSLEVLPAAEEEAKCISPILVQDILLPPSGSPSSLSPPLPSSDLQYRRSPSPLDPPLLPSELPSRRSPSLTSSSSGSGSVSRSTRPRKQYQPYRAARGKRTSHPRISIPLANDDYYQSDEADAECCDDHPSDDEYKPPAELAYKASPRVSSSSLLLSPSSPTLSSGYRLSGKAKAKAKAKAKGKSKSPSSSPSRRLKTPPPASSSTTAMSSSSSSSGASTLPSSSTSLRRKGGASLPRARQIASESDLTEALEAVEAGGPLECKFCGHVQANRRVADFRRHLHTHFRESQECVCYGITVVEAKRQNKWKEGQRKYLFQAKGDQQIQWYTLGCMKAFSRPDALSRHVRHEKGRCLRMKTTRSRRRVEVDIESEESD